MKRLNFAQRAKPPAAAAADPIGRGRPRDAFAPWLRGAVALALVIGCLILFVPFAPNFPTTDLDSGWMFGVNAAVGKGLVFGRDIVFTFGPYAATYTGQYHPATDFQTMWSSTLLAAAFATGLVQLARDRYAASALLTLPMLAFIFGADHFGTGVDPQFFCGPLVFLLLACRIATPAAHPAHLAPTPAVRFALALLALALGLLPLVKGTFGLAAFVAMGLGGALLALRGQRTLALAAIALFAGGIAAFWLIAGQSLGRLPEFFLAQGPIISGYADAMSLAGPTREPIIYVAACGAFALLLLRFFRSAGLSGIALACGLAALLFLVFKAAFVRHDGHALIAAGAIGATGWLLFLALPSFRSLLGLAIGLAAWASIDPRDNNLAAPSLAVLSDRIVQPLYEAQTALAARFGAGDPLRKQFEESLAAISAAQPLPSLVGRSDIYSFGQSALLANGLEWAPRPALQSYSAYTPTLLKDDAAYLAGPTAPDNILFSVQPIDDRLPALDDSLSWPALLTRYEPAALMDGMAVLRRRAQPTADDVLGNRPAVAGAYRMGEEIALPSTSQALWAKVAAKPTWLGKLVGLAYKLPELRIEFHMPDGKISQFRFIAGIGEAGFVASPLVQTASDFVALELPDSAAYFAESRPLSMAIDIVGGKAARWMWGDALSVQIAKMNIPAQAQAHALVFNRSFAKEAAATEAGPTPETNDCMIDIVNDGPADKPVLKVAGVLRVQGWAAMSLADGVAPEQIKLRLVGKNGEIYGLAANAAPRPDVNEAASRPAMGDVGFQAIADVSFLAGDYSLEVLASAKGQTRRCATSIGLSFEPVGR